MIKQLYPISTCNLKSKTTVFIMYYK